MPITNNPRFAPKGKGRPKPDYSRAKGIRVPGDGPMPCEWMMIGERPGKDEPLHRPFPMPFVGMAGMELERYLRMAGLAREQFYITNLVKDYEDADPTQEEIERDAPELWQEIEACQPKVIVAIGAFATRYFLGDVTMESVHGIPHAVDSLRFIAGVDSVVVFPIYHPAAALYSSDIMPFIINDFERLGRYLSGQLVVPRDEHPHTRYVEVSQCQHLPLDCATDTEGWKDKPWGLTYTGRPGEAFLVKSPSALESFRGRLAWALTDPRWRMILHNSLHDLDVLAGLGIDVPEGRFLDTMVLAYLLCIEPQGLKPLAYRHAGMKMSEYQEVLGEANQMIAVEWLHRAAEVDWGPSEHYVIIERGVPKVKKPQPMGQRIRRILNDWEKDPTTDCRRRWTKVREDNPSALLVEDVVGELPEATLDDIPAEVARDYACRDADATLRIAPWLESEVARMGLGEVSAIDHGIIPMVDRMQQVGFGVDVGYFTGTLLPKVEKRMAEFRNAIREMTGADINPDSPPQTRELLFGQLGLPVGKLTKITQEASTQDKVLEGLRHAHPVLPIILDYREHSKVRNSFARTLPRRVSSDGRIRCNLRITRVSSGRLAANSPNLMAIPVRTQLGKEVREGFIATPDAQGRPRKLGSWDLDQIEMRGMAHESGDDRLVGLFQAGDKDVHRETASGVFGISPADVTSGQRYAAKRVGFGVITGITAIGLLDQMKLANTGIDWTEDRCQELIDEWFKMYPGVKQYMLECHAEARRYGYVRDMWGRIRYLPHIHSPIKWVREDAMRQSHSHKIQAGAQGLMKRAMIAVWEQLKSWRRQGLDVECLLQIHDELIFEFQDGLFDLLDAGVVHAMATTTKWRVPVKAKGSQADNWGALKD
jgi:uracil-DNA glycosylase family 4